MNEYPRTDVPAAVQFYVDIIDALMRDIGESDSAPQWNWFAENGPPLIQELQGLRGRIMQDPPAIISGDKMMMLMLRWYNKTLLELSNDLEQYQGLKSPFGR